jgi:hypothetical protein
MLWLDLILTTILVSLDACIEGIIISMYLVQVGTTHQYRFHDTTITKAMKVNSMELDENNLVKFPCVLESGLIPIINTTGLS